MTASICFDRGDERWNLTYVDEGGEVNLKGGDAIIFDEHNAIHPIKKKFFDLLFEKVE